MCTPTEAERAAPGAAAAQRLCDALRTAGDVMHRSTELPLVASGAPFIDGVKAMTSKGFGVLGVTNSDGTLAGLVTDGDLRRYITTGKPVATIDDVMTKSPQVVEPGTLAASAAI